MNDSFFDKLPISPTHWKVFFGSLIAMFIISAMHYLGIRPPKLLTPVSQTNNAFDKVVPLIDTKENIFSLHKESSIIQPVSASSTPDYDTATSYALIDFDNGTVLADKDDGKSVPIASLTKIMTAVVALDVALPSDLFSVSKAAQNEIPTRMGVQAGQKLTLEELLHGMLLTSANDAAEVVREGVDTKYGGNVFIQAMNEKAQFIGLKHTHFANPQGFDDPGNYSSAEDLAILAHYALTNYPIIQQIAQKDYQFLPANQYHKQFDLYNWNGLLDIYPNVQGLKIGNTDAAGMTTVVFSNRGGKKLLAVLLGAPGILKRDLWAAELLDTGYQQTLSLAPVNVTEEQLRAKYATWQYWN